MQIFLNHLFRILRTWAQAYYIKSKFFQFVLYSRVRPIFFILIQHVATSYRLQMSDLLLSGSYLGNFQKRQKKLNKYFWSFEEVWIRKPTHPIWISFSTDDHYILYGENVLYCCFFEGTLLKELVRRKYNY